MAENFGGVKQELHIEIDDLKALRNQIREHESTMRIKRRWLMDLPLNEIEQKRIEELLPPNDKIMPESFLREDDIGYEDIRTCIERAFGAANREEEPIYVQDDIAVLDSSDVFQEVSMLLDAMTNKGLCSFARILTGGSDKFDKTNCGMMRTIRELLPKVIADKNNISRTKLKRCLLLLKNEANFRGHQTITFSESYHAAALRVVEGLDDFSVQALRAMLRKLKGVKGYVPSFKSQYPPQTADSLLEVVRRECRKMLSDMGRVDEPTEQLASALGVACLTLKFIMDRPAVRDFRRFSPEMEALHNDIAKAIHLVCNTKKVRSIELRKVQLLLDLDIELSVRSLRRALREILIEYLYECSDMDSVPNFLIEALDIINGRAQAGNRKKRASNVGLMHEEIEKETRHVLNISAQAKETVANLIPEHEFDEDFAHAYMEDFDGSDVTLRVFDDDLQMKDDSQHFRFHSYSSYDQTEGTGETNPVEFNTPVSTSKRDGHSSLSPNGRSDMDMESMHLNKINSNESSGTLCSPSDDSKVQNSPCLGKQYLSEGTAEVFGRAYSDSVKVTTTPKVEAPTSCSPATSKIGFSAFKVEEMDNVHEPRRSVNGYLELQEACDTTSMVAYRFVGYMLDTLAKSEGLKLDQGDRLYLHSHASIPEDSDEFSGQVVSKFSKMWKTVLEP